MSSTAVAISTFTQLNIQNKAFLDVKYVGRLNLPYHSEYADKENLYPT